LNAAWVINLSALNGGGFTMY